MYQKFTLKLYQKFTLKLYLKLYLNISIQQSYFFLNKISIDMSK